MYERLKRLYEQGRIDEIGIQNAVEKGWITEAEADEIIHGGAAATAETAGDGE